MDEEKAREAMRLIQEIDNFNQVRDRNIVRCKKAAEGDASALTRLGISADELAQEVILCIKRELSRL